MINILANRYTIDSDWCFNQFQKYINKDKKIVIIPFSFRDDKITSKEIWEQIYSKETGIYYRGIVDSFKKYEVKEENIKWINYFSETKEESKKIVENSDILYFTGGLPDRLMERLEEFDLIETIQNHDGLIIGFSAGALIQLSNYHLTPDDDYETFDYYKGLGMISGLNVEVHFTHSDIQMESISRVLKDTKSPVYALEDEGAIIVEKDKVIKVGKVHYFD